MKKMKFLSTGLLVSALFVPQVLWAGPLDGLIEAPSFELPKVLSCNVEGSIKRVNNTTNQISYKVHYGSSYKKENAAFTVFGTVQRPSSNISVYQLRGNTTVLSGEGFFTLNGKQENTFTFPIKDNPGVTLKATVNGVVCGSSYFKTIQPISLITSLPGFSLDVNLNSDAQVDPQLNGSPSQPKVAGGAVSPSNAAIDPNGVVIKKPQVGIDGGAAQGSVPSEGSAGAAVAAGGSVSVDGQAAPLEGVAPQDAEVVSEGTVEGKTVVSGENVDEGEEVIFDDQENTEWKAKDIAIVSLLGALLVSIVAYIVLKYRGLM